MRIPSTKKYLAAIWWDRADVYRSALIDTDEGPAQDFALITEKVPCRISFDKRYEKPGESTYSWSRRIGNDFDAVQQRAVMFCSREADITAGDKLVVTRYTSGGVATDTFTGLVIDIGRPMKYEQHSEFWLRMLGNPDNTPEGQTLNSTPTPSLPPKQTSFDPFGFNPVLNDGS